jgi:DNA-binding GntR family transcriptional regulator
MLGLENRYDFLPAAPLPGRGNLTAFVTDRLRAAIVSLELKPGEVIDKGAICARLGVSRFPVSEALARLQSDGLVDILPQRGSVVSRLRIGDVLQRMLIRKALESEAVRAVALRGHAQFAHGLDLSLAEQQRAVALADAAAFHAQDIVFHEQLLRPLGFDRVTAAIDSARANLDRARLSILSGPRLADTLAEHRAIVAAVLAGDGAAAARAMRAHLDAAVSELVGFARQRPDLFADGDALDTLVAAYPVG